MIRFSNFVNFIIIYPIYSFSITNILFLLDEKKKNEIPLHFKHVLKENYEIKRVIKSSRSHDANRV